MNAMNGFLTVTHLTLHEAARRRVLLAALLLGERVLRVQFIGIVAALAAIALIAS